MAPPRLSALVLALGLALDASFVAAQGVAQAPPPTTTTRTRLMLPTLRLGFGAHVPVNPSTPADASFVFDLRAGVAVWTASAAVSFVPELGYSHDASETRGGDFFTPGLMVTFGSVLLGGGISAQAVVGNSLGIAVYGVRTGAVVQLLAASFTLELGHQWVSAGGEGRDDFRVIASINPVTLLLAGFGIATLASWARAALSGADHPMQPAR